MNRVRRKKFSAGRLDFSCLRSGLSPLLASPSIEGQTAVAAVRCVAGARAIKAFDVLEYRTFGLASGWPAGPPDQICLDGFEVRFC